MNRQSLLVSLFVFLLVDRAFARGDGAKLYEKYKNAVVKIVIVQQGIPVNIGSGFFVGSKGKVITNKHIMQMAARKGFTAEIILADKTVIKEYQIGGCGDARSIDLCVLRVKHRPKSYFNKTAKSLAPGTQLYAIGHPHNYEFTITDGLYGGTRKRPIKDIFGQKHELEEVQFSVPISPGNSGGPVFDGRGRLVAVSTYISTRENAQNLNFGVSAREVIHYLKSYKKFQAATKYWSDIYTLKAKVFDRIFENKYAALLQGFTTKGFRKSVPKGFQLSVTLPIHDKNKFKMDFLVPNIFAQRCRTANTRTTAKVACMSSSGDAMMVFTAIKSAKRYDLTDLNNRTEKPTPLQVVSKAMKSGSWGEIQRTISSEQKKRLYSKPKPISCSKAQKKSGIYIERKFSHCLKRVDNHLLAHAESRTYMFQRKKSPYILTVQTWVADPSKAKLYFGLGQLSYQSGQLKKTK